MSTTALVLFAATFAAVFFLGLQSLNVNGGHRWLAAGTSLLIGVSHLALYKVLPGPTHAIELAAYLLGGPFGIVASMLAHPWLVRRLSARPPSPVPMQDLTVSPRKAGTPIPFEQPRPQRTHTVSDAHMRRHEKLLNLADDLLNPERYGHAVSEEVRAAARRARGEARAPEPPASKVRAEGATQ